VIGMLGPHITRIFMVFAPKPLADSMLSEPEMFRLWMAVDYPEFTFKVHPWPAETAAFPMVEDGSPPSLPYPGRDLLDGLAARAAAFPG